jgi:hypothetical protein
LKTEELLTLLLGGRLLWKLEPMLRRYYVPPGPILALSSVNMQGRGNYVWPRVLQIENIGDKPALEIAWEIRDYYHPCIPPCFTRSTDQRALPLKPQEHFRFDVITENGESDQPGHTGGLSRAHFSHYEIMIWYRGPNRAKHLSHCTLHHGKLTQHQPE